MPTTFDPRAIFECLLRHGVDHIVIGGMAGVAHGVVWPTYDADIIVESSETNLISLVAALSEMEAAYDTPHSPPIRPDLDRIVSLSGPQLFRTKYGRLDVLKEASGETYATLVTDAIESEQFGLTLRCASLRALLRMKLAANRPKDRAAIALLQAALDDPE